MNKLKYTAISLALCLASCSYLDLNPGLGLTENDVFSKLSEFKCFFYSIEGEDMTSESKHPLNIYYGSYPMRMDANTYRYPVVTLTDIADNGRQGLRSAIIKAGVMGENNHFIDDRIPIFQSMFRIIRVMNISLEKIDMVQDATEDEINDLKAQAYFYRAWAHMQVCNFFGGIPYLDHSLQANEEWDLPRDTAVETYQKAAADFVTAYEYFQKCDRVRRDPLPGQPGHLNHSLQNRPNGVAAMALRGRALLYAASPLNNRTNDKTLWEDAAKANAEALQIARDYGYGLMDFEHWTDNLWGVKYTNEHLWADNIVEKGSPKSGFWINFTGYPVSNNTTGGGVNPTQGCVDMYETIWGDPLYTEAEREAAYACTGEGVEGPDGQFHHYYEQNPYKNRDPRMYKNIIYDGADYWKGTGGKPINIYYNGSIWPTTDLNGKDRSFGTVWNAENKANTTTGYYCGTRWDGNYGGTTSYPMTEPLIRLGELYLNYAEAVNEAYGPNGTASGESMTALEALNTIRNRATMPDVQARFTGSTELLRPRIQNERNVEFMFEGHHYYVDERRWMIVPERMRAPLMGMYIESTPQSPTYPNGKKYTRTPIKVQAAWKDAMYYFFLPKEEANKLRNFKNNEPW